MAYPIAKRVFVLLMKLFVKEVNGLENIPKGAYIICANHASYFDHLTMAPFIIRKTNRKVHFLAKKEHFDNFFERKWHQYTGAIPLDRQAGGKEALKYAIQALEEGKVIAIYPEGTRTLTGKLQRGKTGAARLALEADVPILPIGLIGPFELLPKGKLIPKFKRKIIMNIGKPMYFDGGEPREITDKVMKEIARLSNQEYAP